MEIGVGSGWIKERECEGEERVGYAMRVGYAYSCVAWS